MRCATSTSVGICSRFDGDSRACGSQPTKRIKSATVDGAAPELRIANLSNDAKTLNTTTTMKAHAATVLVANFYVLAMTCPPLAAATHNDLPPPAKIFRAGA